MILLLQPTFRDIKKLSYLIVPEYPIVNARMFAVFVRHLHIVEQFEKVAVVLDQKILGAARLINVRQGLEFFRRQFADDPENIVYLSRLVIVSAKDHVDRFSNSRGDLVRPARRSQSPAKRTNKREHPGYFNPNFNAP